MEWDRSCGVASTTLNVSLHLLQRNVINSWCTNTRTVGICHSPHQEYVTKTNQMVMLVRPRDICTTAEFLS